MIRSSHKIDIDIEKKILIGFIISDKFCKEILPITKLEYFSIQFSSRIVTWVKSYFKKYNEAPKLTIQDIFNSEKQNMDSSEADLVSNFLESLSGEYEEGSEFNFEYLSDKARNFFREKSINISASRALSLLDAGKLEEAEKSMRDHSKIVKSISNWMSPLDIKIAEKIFEEKKEDYFRLPGKLGELTGNWSRGELVGVLAPFKRGKSWWLLEIAVWGMINKKRVVYINLEMSVENVMMRTYKRLTAFGDKAGEYLYPCFDCKKNQIGSCKRTERKNTKQLYQLGTEKPSYSDDINYSPCIYCREHSISDYDPETWFVKIKRGKLDLISLKKKISGVKATVGDKFRIITYPAFDANLGNVFSDLDVLELAEGFIPDIVVIDYADILASEDSRVTGRDQIDLTWKALKNLAAKKHCLVVTASQANKVSSTKRSVKAVDVSEDYRKLAHVDCMMILSQTEIEKERGVLRISAIQRHEDYNENVQVQVLYNYTVGQPLIDSEIATKITTQ